MTVRAGFPSGVIYNICIGCDLKNTDPRNHKIKHCCGRNCNDCEFCKGTYPLI